MSPVGDGHSKRPKRTDSDRIDACSDSAKQLQRTTANITEMRRRPRIALEVRVYQSAADMLRESVLPYVLLWSNRAVIHLENEDS